MLLCGYPPFYGETDEEVLLKVKLGNFTFHAADWRHISDAGKSLIRNLLKMNPRDRYTAEQAAHNDWAKSETVESTEIDSAALSGVLKRLCSFRAQSQLRRVALRALAWKLDLRRKSHT